MSVDILIYQINEHFIVKVSTNVLRSRHEALICQTSVEGISLSESSVQECSPNNFNDFQNIPLRSQPRSIGLDSIRNFNAAGS